MNRGIWGGVAAAAVLGLYVCSQAAELPPDYYEEGRAAYARGDYPLAVDRLTEALLRGPGDKRAQRLLVSAGQKIMGKQALDTISLDDLRRMVGEANKVLDQRQKEIRRVLSELKIAQRESEKLTPQETLRACRGVDLVLEVTLGDDPESKEFRDYLHTVCANLQTALDRGILLRPEDEKRVFGYVAFCRSDWEEASRSWEQALTLQPNDPPLRKLWAVAKSNLAQDINEANINKILAETKSVIDAQRDEEALDLLRKGIAEFPGEERLVTLFEITQDRVAERARERVEDVHRTKALAEQKAGQWLAAAQSWLAVLNIDPLDQEARENLDLLRRRLDPSKNALVPSTPAALKQSEEVYTLGLIRYADGDLMKAEFHFKKCLEINPNHEYARKALERVEEEQRPAP